MTKQVHSIVRGQDVVGVAVKNTHHEDLGKIEDIVLDKLSGDIRYVVLSFGGFMGLGDKLFALPWKSISYSAANNCFILNIEKDKLQGAPGFDKDHWPEMSPSQWQQSVDNYYTTLQ